MAGGPAGQGPALNLAWEELLEVPRPGPRFLEARGRADRLPSCWPGLAWSPALLNVISLASYVSLLWGWTAWYPFYG